MVYGLPVLETKKEFLFWCDEFMIKAMQLKLKAKHGKIPSAKKLGKHRTRTATKLKPGHLVSISLQTRLQPYNPISTLQCLNEECSL